MTDDDKRQRRYSITLATSPTMTEEEATRRLRAFLKSALRAFGLRCTSAIEIETQEGRGTQRASVSVCQVSKGDEAQGGAKGCG
jgi:hypothetical protein